MSTHVQYSSKQALPWWSTSSSGQTTRLLLISPPPLVGQCSLVFLASVGFLLLQSLAIQQTFIVLPVSSRWLFRGPPTVCYSFPSLAPGWHGNRWLCRHAYSTEGRWTRPSRYCHRISSSSFSSCQRAIATSREMVRRSMRWIMIALHRSQLRGK